MRKCLTSTGENAEAQAQNDSAVVENAEAEAGEVEGASAENHGEGRAWTRQERHVKDILDSAQ